MGTGWSPLSFGIDSSQKINLLNYHEQIIRCRDLFQDFAQEGAMPSDKFRGWAKYTESKRT